MIYIMTKILANFILKVFFGFRVEGKNNIPKKAPYIVVSNHVSYLDPVVIGCSFPHKVSFMAKSELFKNFLGNWFLRSLGVFPIKREAVDISSIKQSIQILNDGKVLGIFPEGTRSRDGKFKGINKGVIGISVKAKVPIVPVCVEGTYEAWPAGQKFPKLHKIILKIGEPINFLEFFSQTGKIDYNKGAKILEEKIRELLKDEN